MYPAFFCKPISILESPCKHLAQNFSKRYSPRSIRYYKPLPGIANNAHNYSTLKRRYERETSAKSRRKQYKGNKTIESWQNTCHYSFRQILVFVSPKKKQRNATPTSVHPSSHPRVAFSLLFFLLQNTRPKKGTAYEGNMPEIGIKSLVTLLSQPPTICYLFASLIDAKDPFSFSFFCLAFRFALSFFSWT